MQALIPRSDSIYPSWYARGHSLQANPPRLATLSLALALRLRLLLRLALGRTAIPHPVAVAPGAGHILVPLTSTRAEGVAITLAGAGRVTTLTLVLVPPPLARGSIPLWRRPLVPVRGSRSPHRSPRGIPALHSRTGSGGDPVMSTSADRRRPGPPTRLFVAPGLGPPGAGIQGRSSLTGRQAVVGSITPSSGSGHSHGR